MQGKGDQANYRDVLTTGNILAIDSWVKYVQTHLASPDVLHEVTEEF